MITIRRLTREDEPFLWEMLYHALYVPAGQPPFSRDIIHQPKIKRYVENWGRPGDCGVIAYADGQPIGAAWLRLLTGSNKGYGYMDSTTPELSIAILPEYRGQGVGNQLLSDLLEQAQTCHSAVCLSVTQDNPAYRLYQRFGFEIVRKDGNSLTMIKQMIPDKSKATPIESSFIAMPPSGAGPGVLVLHAWWGLNTFFKGFCNRLAGEGFIVLAPDLYHGVVATTIEEAEMLRSKLKGKTFAQEISKAAEQLQAICSANKPGIGVVGFSLGGYWALWLADQVASPATGCVVFYATRGGEYTNSRCAFQFHMAETDDYVAASGIKKLRRSLQAAGRETEFHAYPGTSHWFFEADRPDAYHPQAAELAWSRTVTFLKVHVPS